MSKRDEYIAIIKAAKKATPFFSEDDRIGYLQLAVQDYGISVQEAETILKDFGPTVGEGVNYFEELGLTIEELDNLNDTEIEKLVDDAYQPRYKDALITASSRSTEKRNLLIEAKETLTDPQKRQTHIDELRSTIISTPTPVDPHVDPQPDPRQSTRTIVKFRNGDEAISIPQLATLMEQNPSEATDILYQGYLEQGLAGAGEIPLAQAAKAVIQQFSSDRSTGLVAMVAILREKIKFKRGSEASTTKELARSIDQNDQNWEQAKTLLYNGFIPLWLEFTNPKETKLINSAKQIFSRFGNEQDKGLEELVQKLDPQIGKPEPEASQSEIDFGNMNSESQKTIQFKIKNVGRGFLYGDVRMASSMPGLQISNTEIQGDGLVTIKLDARALTAKQKHQASLVVDTNGGTLKVPVSCYITYPVQNSIQRLAISGFSLAAITLVTRLIIQQFGSSGWLATRLTGAGFTEWEQVWQWNEWFEWPWFEWPVYTLSAPKAGMEFVIALAALGVGIFAYWHFILRKKGMP